MQYFLNKLGFFLIQLWAAITLNFILPRLMPGNPAEVMMAKFHGQLAPQALAALEKQFGIVKAPLYKQYFDYLGSILTGHWGLSFTYYPSKVTTVISQSLPWTLGLLGVVLIISIIVGTLVGIWIAWRRGGVADGTIPIVTMFFQSVPSFFLALILVFYFAFKLHWFPLAHSYNGELTTVGYNVHYMLSILFHSILPAFVVFAGGISGWIIGMRNNMITTLGEDYVVFAEAKGVPQRRLIYSYAARNAILPQLTSFAIALSSIIGGQILIEQVFSYQGIGYQLTSAVTSEDYPLIQAMFLVIAFIALLFNLILDLLYGRLDPRVRRRGATA